MIAVQRGVVQHVAGRPSFRSQLVELFDRQILAVIGERLPDARPHFEVGGPLQRWDARRENKPVLTRAGFIHGGMGMGVRIIFIGGKGKGLGDGNVPGFVLGLSTDRCASNPFPFAINSAAASKLIVVRHASGGFLFHRLDD